MIPSRKLGDSVTPITLPDYPAQGRIVVETGYKREEMIALQLCVYHFFIEPVGEQNKFKAVLACFESNVRFDVIPSRSLNILTCY